VAAATGFVDVVRRRDAASGRSWLFALNHGEETATVSVTGVDQLAQRRVEGRLTLAPGRSAVVRED